MVRARTGRAPPRVNGLPGRIDAARVKDYYPRLICLVNHRNGDSLSHRNTKNAKTSHCGRPRLTPQHLALPIPAFCKNRQTNARHAVAQRRFRRSNIHCFKVAQFHVAQSPCAKRRLTPRA